MPPDLVVWNGFAYIRILLSFGRVAESRNRQTTYKQTDRPKFSSLGNPRKMFVFNNDDMTICRDPLYLPRYCFLQARHDCKILL